MLPKSLRRDSRFPSCWLPEVITQCSTQLGACAIERAQTDSAQTGHHELIDPNDDPGKR